MPSDTRKSLAASVDLETAEAVDRAIRDKGLKNRNQAVKQAIEYWLAHLDLLPRSVAARIMRRGK